VQRPILPVAVVLSLAVACDRAGPTEVTLVDPPASDVVTVTEEQAAQLGSILKIEETEARIWNWTTISYLTVATVYWITPAGPLIPAIRNDALVVRTVNGVTASPISLPGDYALEAAGVRFDYENGLGGEVPDCSTKSGKMTLTTKHWARWSYMLLHSFLTINKGPVNDGDSNECTADPPKVGFDPAEGGCRLCQQWFWVENGQIVDEWWECEPIDPSYCGGMNQDVILRTAKEHGT
jgi:hypothetical protein